MARIGVARKRDVQPIGDRIAGPEIAVERAERKIFDDARRADEIISGVRTKIDRSK